jgi:PPK2 family polyphosphate:nucleotide phosphotransferase
MKKKNSPYLAPQDLNIKDLKTRPTAILSKNKAKKELKKYRKELAEFQARLYAHDRFSVLLCFQGMDTSGKDSLIREVFKDFNVRGVQQHSFKTPTDLELSHGYLWRHYIALPPKGKFGIFNRTHYENVLVTRVHPSYLLAENLPDVNSVDDVDEDFWEMRFEQINNFEKELAQNGTIILKFFLNISKEEQKNRLLRRLQKPEKNWKFSEGDLAERKLWDKYMMAYQEAIDKTNKFHAPWYIIPSDDKPMARLEVAKILQSTLSKYSEVQPPVLSKSNTEKLSKFVNLLENE